MKKLLGVAPGAGGALLDAHGLTGMDAVQIIDKLDAMPVGDRPTDLMASIRPQTLMLSDPESGEKVDVPMPADQVYVSVAPYRQQTHDCHFHSLTTCKGELGNTAAHVKLTTTDGRVIIDEDRTTFDNGFIGLWVPRGLEADLVVTVDGQQATAKVSTKSPEDATCVTTLKLA